MEYKYGRTINHTSDDYYTLKPGSQYDAGTASVVTASAVPASASVLDADKDAHTSVSKDTGAGPFTVLRLTSIHRTKNTLRQWSGAAK